MSSARTRSAWLAPLLLGILCFGVYNANFRTIGSGDTLSARYQPLLLWHDGTLSLQGHERLVAHGHPVDKPAKNAEPNDRTSTYAYWMIATRDGETVSLYPVITPLLVAPLYLPAALYLEHDGWRQPMLDRVAEVMEKLSASLLASLAVVVLFLVLRREGTRWALPLALLFGLGTNTWMISSQALWQHGAGELLVALALWFALGRASPASRAALGAVCVLMAANRPPDALIAIGFGLFVLASRRHIVWLAVGAVPVAAVVLFYNVAVLGSVTGGYGLTPPSAAHALFGWDVWGLPALLVSPTRGLLVFAPFFVFLLIGLRARLRDPETRVLALTLGLAVLAQLALYSQADWRAGASWGPRWLTDLLPILIWMLAPAPQLLRPVVRKVFVATCVFAVAVQAIGAFWYTKVSDERIFAGDPSSKAAAWKPANTPFVVEARHRPAAPDLLCGAAGSVDVVEPGWSGRGRPVLRSGAIVQGWALACRRTPAQVLVLVDGVVVGSATTFLDRSDVVETMDVKAPSGWQLVADTEGITPGPHVLQLAVRHTLRSDLRVVREVDVTVARPPRLDELASRAAKRVRDDQAPAGYWLTEFTEAPTFASARPEMNTYLTSLLVDVLAPLPASDGLEPSVDRARRHLRDQIEPDGLVRYHGLPDAPGIGTLGCVITPDADDTALAWRLSGLGASDPRVPGMLATLADFRDTDGLYRTWLAKRADYQCLDPGQNPNPRDLGIQMHVYLMLRTFDPPAARQLCAAIQRSVADPDHWVYYAKAPTVPYLRMAELSSLGCRLTPSADVLVARQVPGQDIWSELAMRLVTDAATPGARDREGDRRLLERLSAADFAAIRQTPPLLYHNDLTATVPRYYWSPTVGYALWLRLYEASR